MALSSPAALWWLGVDILGSPHVPRLDHNTFLDQSELATLQLCTTGALESTLQVGGGRWILSSKLDITRVA